MKTVLSLFDFSGVWASAFEQLGWSVVCVDLKRGDDIGAWSARSLMRDLLQAFPPRRPAPPVRCSSQGSWLQRLGGSGEATKAARSETPLGFAKAFALPQHTASPARLRSITARPRVQLGLLERTGT